MNLGEFHRQRSKTPSPGTGGGVLPAPLPALGERRDAAPGCSESPWGRSPTPSGAAALSLEGPPGHHRRRRDGHRQNLHRRSGGTHGGLRAGARHLPAPPGSKKWKREIEHDSALGPRRHRRRPSRTWSGSASLFGSGPLFAVMSRERAKLSYRWQPAVIQRWAVSGGTVGKAARLVRDEETGEPFRVPCCPDCTAQIVDKDGVPLTDADLNRQQARLPRLPRSPLAGRQGLARHATRWPTT